MHVTLHISLAQAHIYKGSYPLGEHVFLILLQPTSPYSAHLPVTPVVLVVACCVAMGPDGVGADSV